MPLEILRNSATLLKISDIRTDGGTQPRAGIDQAVVDDYAERMEDGDQFPPVDVYYDGQSYWLIDGFHRIAAYRKTSRYDAPALIHQGTLVDAQWASLGANRHHGLRRTNDDKQRSVIRALQHEKAKTLSDEQIAQHVGVSRRTVLRYRQQLVTKSQDSIPVERTVTRGDQTYTMNTANIGATKPTATVDDLTRHIGSWLSQQTGNAVQILAAAVERSRPGRKELEAFLRRRDVNFAVLTLEEAIAEVLTNLHNTVGPNATVTGPMPTITHKDVADLKKAQAQSQVPGPQSPASTDNTSLSVDAPTIERTASGLPRMTLIEHALTHEDDFYPLSQKQVDELVKQFETEGWKFYQVGDNWQAIHHHDQVATPILADIAELLDALDDGNYTEERYFIDAEDTTATEPPTVDALRISLNLEGAVQALSFSRDSARHLNNPRLSNAIERAWMAAHDANRIAKEITQ